MTVNITADRTTTYSIDTLNDHVFLADIFTTSGAAIEGNAGSNGSTVTIIGRITSNADGFLGVSASDTRIFVAPTGAIIADRAGVTSFKEAIVAGFIQAGWDGISSFTSDARVTVSGMIDADDAAILVGGAGSRIDIAGSGVVRGGSDSLGYGTSAAILLTGTLNNAGTIIAKSFGSPEQEVAVRDYASLSSGAADETVVNTGLIVGDVRLGGGSDLYDGSGGGVVTGTIDLGSGADRMIGGSGVETLTYATSDAGVIVDLVNGVGSGGHAEGDRISGVEYLVGSAHEDTLIGDAAANNFMGGDSRDVLLGGAQGDVLRGEGGNDLIGGGEGWDWIEGGEGNDGLDAGSGNDWVFGGNGNDTLIGDAGDDTLAGEAGSDTYSGGTGSDLFRLDVLGGVDTVTDFTPGADRLRVDGATQNTATIVANAVQTDGGSTILVLENSTQVALLGVTGITADWFA